MNHIADFLNLYTDFYNLHFNLNDVQLKCIGVKGCCEKLTKVF